MREEYVITDGNVMSQKFDDFMSIIKTIKNILDNILNLNILYTII